MKKIQLLHWLDEYKQLDEIYVSLELEEDKQKEEDNTETSPLQNTETSTLQQNEDLVTLTTSDNKPATRVLIKGIAGSGKSTLLARLAYGWAQQNCNSPLTNFDLLFIVSLCKVDKDNDSLIDAILQQIPDDTNIAEHQLHEFITTNSSKIIILLDGLDEYAIDIDKRGKQNGINRILQFEALRDCHVIVSTRPHKLLNIKYQSIYISVNLTGFSSDNVDLYITKFFDGNSEMADGLRRKLKESDILTSLSNTPVMLMLMCLLWQGREQLPNTQSELYEKFARYLWRKYSVRLG